MSASLAQLGDESPCRHPCVNGSRRAAHTPMFDEIEAVPSVRSAINLPSARSRL